MEINGRESIFINGGNEPPLNQFLTPEQLEYAVEALRDGAAYVGSFIQGFFVGFFDL